MNTASLPLRRSTTSQTSASATRDFERIMASIFSLTGRPTADDGHRRAYRIRVDGAFELNLFPDPQGNLVITGTSRSVNAAIGPDQLLKLLQLNTYFPSIHHVSVGFLQESRRMQIWSRHPMHKMNGKDAVRMLKLMGNAVSHINAMLS